MARQRAAYGSIAPTVNGVTRVRYWADLGDGKGYRRVSKSIRGNRRAAQEFLSKIQIEHNEDKPILTVIEIYKLWYVPGLRQRNLAPSTLNLYAGCWKAHIEPKFGNMPVNSIRPLDVQEWLYTKSKNQAALALKILKPLMDYAVRYELVAQNVFAIDYVMPRDMTERDKGIYTLAQCKQIAEAFRASILEAAVILAAFGSCRTGEALGVMASDIEFVKAANGMDCAVVEIQRQCNEQGKLTERLKTKGSARFVVVPSPWAERLRELTESHNGLLTCSCEGTPLNRFTAREIWIRGLDKAGIEQHPFQNLRNSWRTYMEWELHADTEKLEKLMGHKGKSVTARHYNRPEVKQLVDLVAEVFEGCF